MGGKAIDLEWLKENAPGMTLDEIVGAIGGSKEYIRKTCNKNGIPYASMKKIPEVPKEGVTREWLMAVRRFNPQSVARKIGMTDKELAEVYREVMGEEAIAPKVKAPASGCVRCDERDRCSGKYCLCELVEYWEMQWMKDVVEEVERYG